MFPTKTLEPACLFPVSLTTYHQWLTEQMEGYNTRQINLKSLEIDRSKFPDTNNTKDDKNDDDDDEFFLKPNDFCFRLKLQDGYFGIEAKKAQTTRRCIYDFSLCDCKKKPSNHFKKQIILQQRFDPRFIYANSPEFKSFRYDVEKKVSLLEHNYIPIFFE